MPDSIEQRVDSHRLVTERRNAGKPIWQCTIDVSDLFRNESLQFPEKCRAIASRFLQSQWLRDCGERDAIHELLDELTDADDADHFDVVWDQIYDEANYARAWIVTRSHSH